jgi:hypothetical protein
MPKLSKELRKSLLPSRNRTIRWPQTIDAAAQDLVFSRKLHGGVSELLVRLVIAESKRKRGIVHLQELPTPSR